MKVIEIQIEDVKLANLGIDAEPRYAPFTFNEAQFLGYWFDKGGETVHVYIGAHDFICENSEANIKLFKSMLQ